MQLVVIFSRQKNNDKAHIGLPVDEAVHAIG